MIKLNDLPSDHPLRNTRISELNPKLQWEQGGPLKPVFPTFKVAKLTFNDLGPAWTESTYWWVEGSSNE